MTASETPQTPHPTTPFRRLRPAALAAVVANVGIVLTGGIVRVTGSGLGCPDWPTCNGSSVVPTPGAEAAWHQVIEFGNRTLTGVLLAIAVWVVVAHRRDLAELGEHVRALPTRGLAWVRRLVWVQPIGILVQAVLGGITVLTELNPLVVALHFVLSMVLIAAAVALRHAVTDDRPAVTEHGPAGGLLATATSAVTVVAALVLVIGTVVTAAGPHAGDPGTPRLGVSIRAAALAHADAVWLLLGLTIAVALVARAVGAASVSRAAGVLLLVELAQGGIGYTQYALGIPPALVSLHLLGASLVWVATVRLLLVSRAPVLPPPVEPLTAARRSHVTVTTA